MIFGCTTYLTVRRYGLSVRAGASNVLTAMCCCFCARRCQALAIKPHAACRSTHVLHTYRITACLPAQANASLWCRYGLWVPAQQQQFQLLWDPSAHVAAAYSHSSTPLIMFNLDTLVARRYGSSLPAAQSDQRCLHLSQPPCQHSNSTQGTQHGACLQAWPAHMFEPDMQHCMPKGAHAWCCISFACQEAALAVTASKCTLEPHSLYTPAFCCPPLAMVLSCSANLALTQANIGSHKRASNPLTVSACQPAQATKPQRTAAHHPHPHKQLPLQPPQQQQQ